ncbi:hypothetical protein MMC34_002959 [Xylographa carneopallida]|nr:hypothetical protein [Xylographa carneopallida]
MRLLADKQFDSSLSAAMAWASRMGHLDIVELLIKHGVPSITDLHDGRSAYSWACVGGFIGIADALLACDKTLINIRDASGYSPLTLAVQYEHVGLVNRLLATEAIEVNLPNAHGKTPIFFVCGKHDLSAKQAKIFSKLLHDPCTDVAVRSDQGRSLLSYLYEYGATTALDSLLDCRPCAAELTTLLDDAGDAKGLSPLSYAATWGHVGVIRRLCRTGQIGTQLRSVDTLDGANAFDVAAKNARPLAIAELAAHHAPGVHSRDRTGRTPLSVAMWGADPAVLRVLLAEGADANDPDDGGRPPVAFGIDKIALVTVLVEEGGADINRRDGEGHAPLWYADRGSEGAEERLRALKALGARL